MRRKVFVVGMLAVMVLFATGASSQVAVIVQPGTIIGSVEANANAVLPNTNVDIFTVPAGVRFKITDIIISNYGTVSTCRARIFTGPAAALGPPRTGDISVPAGGAVEHSFLNGITFNAGETVTVRNSSSALSDVSFTMRGHLYTRP